jgi:N-acetylglucosamine-6-phosphate deacetylase
MIREAHSWSDLVDCYGEANLGTSSPGDETLPSIRKITVAPEQGQMMSLIQDLTSRNIIVSIGHSDATFEDALAAVKSGARMTTHLFNAMKPLHHRNPGIFGLLGVGKDRLVKPYFGMIADGIHVHPTAVQLAYNAHPEGLILVTDAMHLTGLPDGAYPWTNGDSASTIVKKGSVLCLEGTDKIAGRYVQG